MIHQVNTDGQPRREEPNERAMTRSGSPHSWQNLMSSLLIFPDGFPAIGLKPWGGSKSSIDTFMESDHFDSTGCDRHSQMFLWMHPHPEELKRLLKYSWPRLHTSD